MAVSVLIALALQAARPAYVPPDLFELLVADEWVCRVEWLASGPVNRSETWRRDGDRLIGIVTSGGRWRAGRPSPRVAELVIAGRGAGRTLVYRPAGGAPVRYRLLSEDRAGREALFRSLGRGSPRTIQFRYGGFATLTVTHVAADGTRESWSYEPTDLRSGPPDCSGRR
jgi:hypothetical protein